jgi:NAD(P)-dependent dehydrogenase (short-subunit alcohol dehydrogenase family)
VNNAGIAIASPLLDESIDDWRASLEINLEAAYFLAQRAFEHMRVRRTGRVVNIASVYGVMGFDNREYGSRAPQSTPGDRGPVRQSAYAASKGGLVQLTRDLAAAVGRWGITVNAISPGSIPHGQGAAEHARAVSGPVARAAPEKPGLGDAIDPAILEALAAQVPLGRLGRVEEIAGPVSFLLSDDASYVTGQNLVVDGGWSIWR